MRTITPRRCSSLISKPLAKVYQILSHETKKRKEQKCEKVNECVLSYFIKISCPFSFFVISMVLK